MYRTGLLEFEAAIALARHKNFRSAALELGVSPSALSSLIRGLESRVGVRIFNRTTRSVALTSAGSEFVARIGVSISSIKEAMEVARGDADKPQGTLRINTSVTAAHLLLQRTIDVFLQQYPEVSVELIADSRLVDIVLDGADAGIRAHDSVPRDMVAVPAGFALDFSIVGSPSYFKSRAVPLHPSELSEHVCIRSRMASGAIYKWEFREPVSIDVPGKLILDDQHLILEAAKNGLGLAYLADAVTQRSIETGELQVVLHDWRPERTPLSFYYPNNRNTPSHVRAFAALLREQGRGRVS